MLPANELQHFAEVCTSIGNEVADDEGFVPIRNLLARFHTSLLIRPLLVEGMLASLEQSSGSGSDRNRWAVLLDSETYPIDESKIDKECREQPLPSRLRNTIAHELVHSLAFRPSEFGIQLRQRNKNEKSQSELVRSIERETERLSPLLLWPEKALTKLLAGKKQALSVEDLRWICRSMGISRYVLINRLCLLRPTDPNGFRYRDGLKDLAIGVGSWVDGRNAVFRSWPLFINFDRNIVPAFLHKLVHQDRTPAKSIFADELFAMCGGPQDTIDFVTDAGSSAVPNAERMRLQCSIERVNKKKGQDFLYVLRKAASDESVNYSTVKSSSAEMKK